MQSRKIIVIDDEVMVTDVSRRILTRAGHQVVCAYSGEQAVELAMASRFDLAIIDAMLPGMTGVETFETLSQICPYMKGLLVSGDLTRDMTIEAMDIGFSRVLVKPLQSGDLLRVVQEVLAESDMQQENTRLKKQVLKIQTLFERYMAPEVAAILLNRQDAMQAVVGEVREITVLYADIRNFTFLVQHIPLLDSQKFLTEFFDLVADVISSRQGTLDKFIGDAVLAIFGAPGPLDSSNQSAVSAAIEIKKGFEALRARWVLKSELFMQIGLGIGISRGDMYLGNVGSGRRLDYTVVGADVTIAQRLASDTVADQILITDSVYCDVASMITVQEKKTRLLRGLEKKIRIYSIIPLVD
jgi:class 3 adenylate cyclase/CheY-like chemotaxis protein